MPDFFVLLNDGTSNVLLNDGSSKVLLNGTVTGVDLVGDHAIAKYGDKRLDQQDKMYDEPFKSLNRLGIEAPDTILEVRGKIRTKIRLRVESKILYHVKLISTGKIMRESIRKTIGKIYPKTINRLRVESRISKDNIHEIYGKLPRYVTFKHEHDKKSENMKKDIKKLFDMYKESLDG